MSRLCKHSRHYSSENALNALMEKRCAQIVLHQVTCRNRTATALEVLLVYEKLTTVLSGFDSVCGIW